jgi:hypothetical protein
MAGLRQEKKAGPKPRPGRHLQLPLVLLAVLGAYRCGATDTASVGTPVAAQALATALTGPKRDALIRDVERLVTSGTLRGPGVWQRDAACPKGSQQAVPVHDDAKAQVMDGYRYTALLMPSRPRLTQVADDATPQDADVGPEADPSVPRPCPRPGSHVMFYVEREGGILGAKALVGPLIVYSQDDHTQFCACPAAALAERLPLCCAPLCKI